MKFALTFLVAPIAVMAAAVDPSPTPVDSPAVFTVQQIFMTIIDVEPFMVPVTETLVWTQSPSLAVSTPTAAPKPTLDPGYDAEL